MADYSDIIEGLEKATGPDRELDYRIAYLIDLRIEGMGCTVREYCEVFKMDFAKIIDTGDWHTSILRHDLPRYTASVDATLALFFAKLPNWHRALVNRRNRYEGTSYEVAEIGSYDWDWDAENIIAEAPTPAIALLIAMFRALKSEETKP